MGLLNLGNLFYVVPPDTKFIFEAPTDTKLRIRGEVLELAPGEPMPDPLMGRFAEQGRHFFKYVQGTFSLGVDVVWADRAEYEVLTITPLTIETIWFNRELMCEILNLPAGVAEGDISVNVYLDNVPLPFDWAENIAPGFDFLSLPRPPAEGTNLVPFSFAEYPIEVKGDETISLRVRNTSGADITPPTGTSIDITITAIVDYLKKVG